ncbi:MAG: helix-turn-helix domain-containing protein [Gaiellaceae bacterium]
MPATHVDDPRQLGRRLRETREGAGLSQRALSFPGCTSAYVSRIESGDRVPSLQLIHEFARRLKVSPSFLTTCVEVVDSDHELLDAEVALRLGELDEARTIYDQRLAESPEDATALGGLGEIACREGRLAEAIGLLERSLAAREGRLLEDTSSVESLARTYAQSGSLDAALALLERALAQAVEAHAPVEVLRFRVLLANALIDNGQIQRAEQMLARTIADADDLRDPLAVARVYWSQSRLHTHHKDPQLGVRYARRAIEILERSENDAYLAKAYHLLAFAEVEAGNAGDAIEHLEQGRKALGDALEPYVDAKFAIEESRALLALGRPQLAAERATCVLDNAGALDPQDRGRAYALFGDVFREIGDRHRAAGLYEQALAAFEGDGRHYLVEVATRLAELLDEDGKPAEGLAVLQRAIAATREPGARTRAAAPAQR